MEKKTRNGLGKIVTEITYSEMLRSPSVIRVDYLDEIKNKFGNKCEKIENPLGYTFKVKSWNSEISLEVLYGDKEKLKIETKRIFYKKMEHSLFIKKFYSVIEKYIENSKKCKVNYADLINIS